MEKHILKKEGKKQLTIKKIKLEKFQKKKSRKNSGKNLGKNQEKINENLIDFEKKIYIEEYKGIFLVN